MTYIVYMHTCRVNGKSYVGLTSRTMDARWAEHVRAAFDVRYPIPRFKFHRAVRKYGADAWDHVVLRECQTLEEAECAEIALIGERGTLTPHGYNLTRGGRGVVLTADGCARHREATRAALRRPDVHNRLVEGVRRGHRTPEARERNSVAQRASQRRPDVVEKKRTSMLRVTSSPRYVAPMARAVQQLNDRGEVIATYRSAKEASDVTGANHSKITEVARGSRKRSGGYVWRYCDER